MTDQLQMTDQPQTENTRNPYASGMATAAVVAGLIFVAIDFFGDGSVFSEGWLIAAFGGSLWLTGRQKKEEADA